MKELVNRLPLMGIILLMLTIIGCKKTETPKVKTEEVAKNYTELLNYFSNSLGVSKDRIEFDNAKKSFVFKEANLTISIAELQEGFDKANEYKITRPTEITPNDPH